MLKLAKLEKMLEVERDFDGKLQGVCEDAIPLVMKMGSVDIDFKVIMYCVVKCLFHNLYWFLSATFLGPIDWRKLQQTESKQVSINLLQWTVCNKKGK